MLLYSDSLCGDVGSSDEEERRGKMGGMGEERRNKEKGEGERGRWKGKEEGMGI